MSDTFFGAYTVGNSQRCKKIENSYFKMANYFLYSLNYRN